MNRIKEFFWLAYGRTADTLQVFGLQSIFVVLGSFALPAWAVWYADLFAQSAPLSWVVAGFAGVGAWAFIRLLWQWGNTIKVQAIFNARALERGELINPLESTFEKKRIFLNDFVLPSHTFIENKNFIDCDLIGPANIYFPANNIAMPIRPPKIDAVWLGPDAIFFNGFIFSNCLFKNCSFQRITMFASIENYLNWKDNPNINWIGIAPSEADLERRRIVLEATNQPDGAALQATKRVPEANAQITAITSRTGDKESPAP